MSMEELDKKHMVAHLSRALDQGQDVGHYGRLVYATVGRHFVDDEELIAQLAKDGDFDKEQARTLVQQVQEHGDSPPGHAKILETQAKQDFPIVPEASDPDEDNVYRDIDPPFCLTPEHAKPPD